MGQALLSTESEQSELLLSAASDAIFLVDLETGAIVNANQAVEDITLFALERLLGKPASVLTPTAQEGRRETRFGPEIFETEGTFEEVAVARSDGFRASVSVRVMHRNLNQRPTAVCVVRDETARRMLERELITKHMALLNAHKDLEERKKEIGELSARIATVSRRAMLAEVVAEVAHSVNNPLAAMISTLRQLDRFESALEGEQRQRYQRLLDRCGRAAEKVTGVVDELRVTCRQGAQPRVLPACELSDQVRSAVSMLEHRTPARVQLRLELEPAPARVPADEVHHAIINLVDNALHELGSEGIVRVRCKLDGEWAIIEVADDGPGIDPEIADSIFDPFFSTKATGQGTGVGLSMVRRMAARFGGCVTAEPHGELGGATFRIQLPRQPKEASEGSTDV